MANCIGAGESPAETDVVFCGADSGAAIANPPHIAAKVVNPATVAVLKTENGLISIQGIRLSFGKRAPLAPIITLRDEHHGVNVKFVTALRLTS